MRRRIDDGHVVARAVGDVQDLPGAAAGFGGRGDAFATPQDNQRNNDEPCDKHRQAGERFPHNASFAACNYSIRDLRSSG
jgi:hypothetical protein